MTRVFAGSFQTLSCFFSVGVEDFTSAKNVLLKYEEEGILPSTRTLQYLSKELTANGIDVDFYVPKPVVQIFIINIIIDMSYFTSGNLSFAIRNVLLHHKTTMFFNT